MLLDTVSVVDVTNTSVELLNNPGFDSSTASPPTGWYPWCSSTCTAGSPGALLTFGCQTGYCYKSQCAGSGGRDYLVQSFSATVGGKYTLSFYWKRGGSFGGNSAGLYVDII
jgi:hypothetical protein